MYIHMSSGLKVNASAPNVHTTTWGTVTVIHLHPWAYEIHYFLQANRYSVNYMLVWSHNWLDLKLNIYETFYYTNIFISEWVGMRWRPQDNFWELVFSFLQVEVRSEDWQQEPLPAEPSQQ